MLWVAGRGVSTPTTKRALAYEYSLSATFQVGAAGLHHHSSPCFHISKIDKFLRAGSHQYDGLVVVSRSHRKVLAPLTNENGVSRNAYYFRRPPKPKNGHLGGRKRAALSAMLTSLSRCSHFCWIGKETSGKLDRRQRIDPCRAVN